MNFNNFLLADAVNPNQGVISTAMTVGSFVLLIVVFYFFAIRPQKKQEKQVREMRASIEVGDAITTSGGIVGVVVKIKDDMILIESGADRTKLQIQKWAVHSVLAKAGEEKVD